MFGRAKFQAGVLIFPAPQHVFDNEDLEKKRAYMEGRIPLGRLGQPRDLAGPAVFLASDMSAYMSGSQMLVDGGAFVNLQ